MSIQTYILTTLLGVLFATGSIHATETSAPKRIVSTNGTLTEIVYALGADDLLVGVDLSSVYPESATKHAIVGYSRNLSAEGILSLNPDWILLTEDAGPPPVIQQIQSFKIPVITLTADSTLPAAEQRIIELGKVLKRETQAQALVEQLQKDCQHAQTVVSQIKQAPKVLFLYSRGGGMLNVAGTGTAADEIIRLSGATNAVHEFRGYKPLTAESAILAAPDYILITTRGLQAAGGKAALFNNPGLAETPAGKAGNVVVIDDLYLLGFGPRTGKVIAELAQHWLGKPEQE